MTIANVVMSICECRKAHFDEAGEAVFVLAIHIILSYPPTRIRRPYICSFGCVMKPNGCSVRRTLQSNRCSVGVIPSLWIRGVM